jgi:hypothetical protein
MRDAGAHVVDALVARRSELNAHAVSHPAMRSPSISALFTEAALQQPALEGKVQMGLA